MPADTRATAALVIGEVLGGVSLARALPPRLAAVADRDRGLLRELCYGTLRDAPRLQALLERLLAKPLRGRDRDVIGLLLCGLYQLEGTGIPDHAAVAATVDAVDALRKGWARKLVNAVLRRFLREREALVAALATAAAARHPQWLYRALRRHWPDAADAILQADNERPPMTLRVNARRLTRDEYLARLAAAGIPATAGTLAPQAVRLDAPRDVAALPGFAEGEVSVQDEAAQLAALLLAAAPGERVLDACAAPGGKACHILELQPALAELVAVDIDGERLARVEENLHRLQLQAVLTAGDAGALPGPGGRYDRILLDAPCSATGVIRRHPDVKLLRREADIPALAERQHALLCGLWPLLVPGGSLLYATCSVLPEENDAVVERFLQGHADARVHSLEGSWGVATPLGRQLLPQPGGADGLYYALLRKAVQ